MSPMLLMEASSGMSQASKTSTSGGAVILHKEGFVAVFFSNVLYLIAGSYYHYLSFLGYNALPFLEKTEYFLSPIGILLFLFPLALLSNFKSRIPIG